MSRKSKRLEKAIRDSVKIGPTEPKSTMDKIVAMVAAEVEVYCPNCDRELMPWERFCVGCGQPNGSFDLNEARPAEYPQSFCENNHEEWIHDFGDTEGMEHCMDCGAKVF